MICLYENSYFYSSQKIDRNVIMRAFYPVTSLLIDDNIDTILRNRIVVMISLFSSLNNEFPSVNFGYYFNIVVFRKLIKIKN